MKISKNRLRELIVEECATLEEGEATKDPSSDYILEEISRQLDEAETKLDLYILTMHVTYNKSTATNEILNQIRAIEGVTRCSPQGEADDIGLDVKRHLLDVKVALKRGSIQAYIRLLLQAILKLQDVVRVRLTKATQVER